LDGRQDHIGGRPRFGPPRHITARRGDQDMRGLIEISRPKARTILLIEPQTCGLVELRCIDFALDQRTHRCFF
jgi:hypothetical protein